MKINMNNSTIMTMLEILDKFDTVTGPLAMAIRKTRKGLMEECEIFIQERNKLIKKFDAVDENGNIKTPEDPEKLKEFADAINEMMMMNSEIEIYQVSQEVFDKADIYNEKCSVRDYDILEALMVENKLKIADTTKEDDVEEAPEEVAQED